jgi:transcriptional regulator GlxA family with amidase domain
VPVAAYARSLRLQWAIDRLADSTLAISDIAVSAGFSDQSHLTRECRRSLGVSPAEYRRNHGCAQEGSGR